MSRLMHRQSVLPMSAIDHLVQLLDDSMFHRDESVLSALDGVAEAEAGWQHPAFVAAESWPGMPAPGTIAWHVAHLVHSARHYAAIVRERPVVAEPQTPPPEAHDFAELLVELRDAHTALVRTVSTIPESALAEECARGLSLGEFLGMVMRHNTWHAGQIKLLRRLRALERE